MMIPLQPEWVFITHDNMEIITIPLEGDLAHKDSMGNTEIIRNGDVQVMSAGTE
jgi:redox-sensitive bicupin YhaK (pirin superfamily)